MKSLLSALGVGRYHIFADTPICRYCALPIPPILPIPIPLDRAASQLKSHDGIGIGIELKASTFKGEIGIGIELKGFGPASELNQNRLLTELHITVVNQQ